MKFRFGNTEKSGLKAHFFTVCNLNHGKHTKAIRRVHFEHEN